MAEKKQVSFRDAFKSSGLTQVQLAKMAGLSKAYVSEVARGKSPASDRLVDALAVHLGIDPSEISPRTEPPAPQEVTPPAPVQATPAPGGHGDLSMALELMGELRRRRAEELGLTPLDLQFVEVSVASLLARLPQATMGERVRWLVARLPGLADEAAEVQAARSA